MKKVVIGSKYGSLEGQKRFASTAFTPGEFADFFKKTHKGVSDESEITRIEFYYLFHCPTCGLPFNPFKSEVLRTCVSCGNTGATSCCHAYGGISKCIKCGSPNL